MNTNVYPNVINCLGASLPTTLVSAHCSMLFRASKHVVHLRPTSVATFDTIVFLLITHVVRLVVLLCTTISVHVKPSLFQNVHQFVISKRILSCQGTGQEKGSVD